MAWGFEFFDGAGDSFLTLDKPIVRILDTQYVQTDQTTTFTKAGISDAEPFAVVLPTWGNDWFRFSPQVEFSGDDYTFYGNDNSSRGTAVLLVMGYG